jgi:hypothetical protein
MGQSALGTPFLILRQIDLIMDYGKIWALGTAMTPAARLLATIAA